MTTKIFLASSAELEEDRKNFEILINRQNKTWKNQGVFLELIVWEDFLDAMSRTRLQDEYNKAIHGCDVFVMLFFTKVGPYTAEEFEVAFKQSQATNRPFIFTYFKDAQISTTSANMKDVASLLAFRERLDALGHFCTVYKNIEGLQLHFLQQLHKLAASGAIDFKPQDNETGVPDGGTYQATLTGDGAIAQGAGATAVGRGGVLVQGNNTGRIITGTQTTTHTGGGAYIGGNVDTGGGNFTGRDSFNQGVSLRDLGLLFAPLLAAVAAQAPAGMQATAVGQVEQLKAEVGKGKQAHDGKVAKLVNGLVGLVPGAVGAIVSAFASPILSGIAGPVTKIVLDKLKAD